MGFKFHAVLVVNSAHLASLASPDEHRWLPIFWALDYFKEAQAQDVREGDWTMRPVDESAVPPEQRRERFIAAMDNWDEAAADAAVAALARTAGANDVYELMFRYGAPRFPRHRAQGDLRGQQLPHAQVHRLATCRTGAAVAGLCPACSTKGTIRPRGTRRPTGRAKEPRTGRRIRPDWLEGKLDGAATADMLSTLRQASADEICDHVVEVLNRGIAPQAIWDALFVGAGELLARQPGIVALHSVTSTNALRFAWDTVASDETRRMLLLQNAAFVTLFRQEMKRRGELKPLEVDWTSSRQHIAGDEPRPSKTFSPRWAATAWRRPAKSWPTCGNIPSPRN